jgi:protein-S-isoprenylcysteine O-methyltransferase Ste14
MHPVMAIVMLHGMRTYDRIFGAGPRGLLSSLAFLAFAWYLKSVVNLPRIIANDAARWAMFIMSTVGTTLMLIWSVKSLRPEERGVKLVTTGAYRYLRHPLYAAFLSCFNFGLAVLLNNWIYIIWAILVHGIWHWNIGSEETLMKRAFPKEYEDYCKITGRFVPRFKGVHHNKPTQSIC